MVTNQLQTMAERAVFRFGDSARLAYSAAQATAQAATQDARYLVKSVRRIIGGQAEAVSDIGIMAA